MTHRVAPAVLAGALLLGLLGRSGRAQEPPSSGQKLALYTKPAVVRIYGAWVAEYKFNNRTWREAIGGSGSGFFLTGDGYIATNAHVVQVIHDGEDKAKEALAQEVVKEIIQAYKADFQKMNEAQARQVLANVQLAGMKKLNFVVLPNGDHAEYDVKAYGAPVGEGKDCAIIKIPTKNAPTLPIGDPSKAQIQDKVYVIGYPGVADVQGVLDEKSQLEASITDGTISAIKNTAAGDQVLQVSAPITHGNSGGPAVNQRGEVMGLATFGNLKEVQGFNFLVSATTLGEFVRQAGAGAGGSDTDREWRTALDLFWDQRYTAAIEKLEEVVGLFPAHVEAKKLLDEARELKRAGKERHPFPIWIVVAGAAAVLAAASAFFFVRYQRAGSRPARAVRPALAAAGALGGGAAARPRALPAHGAPVPIPETMAVDAAAVPETLFVDGRVATVTCTGGPLEGQRFSLTAEGLLVGRQPGVAHIVVDDRRASGEHVWLRWEQGKLIAIDQGTTNGTFLNDIKRGRISRAELRDGDTVIVADPDCCSLTVKLG